MNRAWPIVKLGDAVRYRKEFITIDDLASYKRPRVQLHVQGIVLRDEVPGALIKTKSQQVCRTGELLVAEIDAKVGGFGIVPKGLNGSIVSSHYFLFVIDETKLDQRFLDFFIRTPAFREQVGARGSTNYAAIRPAHVLEYEMPLPPLAEQRRMVARIEELTDQIHEARSLRRLAAEEAEALCRALITQDPDAKPTQMKDLVRMRPPDVTVRPDETYQFAGVYCFGRGVFRSQLKSGLDFAYPKLTRLRSGNFVYPKLMAWEGAFGVVPRKCDGCVVSTEFPVFDILEDRVFHEVLDTYFRMPAVWAKIAGSSTGTNVRRRRLNPIDFLNYKIPLPSRATQERLRKVSAEVDVLKRLQDEIATELDAMLPAILDRAFCGRLVLSDFPTQARAVTAIGAHPRAAFSPEDYFVQLIPALLRAGGGRLELDKLNAAVALLFLPKILHPLIASIGDPEAQAHFDRFDQPLKDSAFIPMLHVLTKTGAITCVVDNQVTSLQLHESAAPPIKPAVEEDARFLAVIMNLIPSSPVQATVSKLCPELAKEELLAMA
jgi:type I restriction enzyme S subunit